MSQLTYVCLFASGDIRKRSWHLSVNAAPFWQPTSTAARPHLWWWYRPLPDALLFISYIPLHRSTSLYSWRQLHTVPQLADCRTWKWQLAALGLQLLQLVTPSCWKDAGSYPVDCECHSLLHQGLELSQFVTYIDSTVVTPRIWSVTAFYAQDSNCRSLPYSRRDSLLH